MTAGPSAVVLLISALNVLPVGSLKFFHVSDVHLDPFYNKAADVSTYCQGSGLTADYEAPYGRIGCDSPLALWKIALLGMKEEGQSAEFMMLSGMKLTCFCKLSICLPSPSRSTLLFNGSSILAHFSASSC